VVNVYLGELHFLAENLREDVAPTGLAGAGRP
jgi:hypothetical protein